MAVVYVVIAVVHMYLIRTLPYNKYFHVYMYLAKPITGFLLEKV